jgi:serine/threonine protein kinase
VAAQLPQPIQFGKYSLFERIGRGGMAEVYKGRIQGPQGFERVFVVKRILSHLSDDPTFIKMFVEEAKLSARLNHPNIVQIFELGAVEGEYFISMEYIRGHDLAETMRAIWKTIGPPRPELVAYIGREACRALSYAHSLTDEQGRPLGMIHRDVSPSNIMLSYEGAVKLLDFGIAKALGEAPETTKSGTMKGKYAYMAPEQTEGDDVDRRIDIFSCGIVLHEVLTGRRLFKGSNDVLTIERVRRCEVPPPSRQNPAVPPELDAIVLKALAKDRNQRFASAADMADALDDVVHAARFQPTHLAQMLHDLFPVEGGGPVHRPSVTSGNISHSSIPSMRSPTVPPVSRSFSPSRPSVLDGEQAELSLKPKTFWKVAGAAALGLLVVGLVLWKGILNRPIEGPHAAVSDPARRFHVFVKSEPPGADLFLGAEKRPMAATPVTIPIDLTGVSSVRLTLKKQGFEDYEQIVVNDTPLSIVLKPLGADPVVPAPAAAPTAPDRGSSSSGSAGSSDRTSGHQRHRSSSSSSSSPPSPSSSSSSSSSSRPASNAVSPSKKGHRDGELVDPF